MKKILFVLIFLSLMTLTLVGLAITLKRQPEPKAAGGDQPRIMEEELAEPRAGTVLITAEIVPATAAGTPAYVKLAVAPVNESVTLSAFDLRLLVKAMKGSVRTGGAIVIGENLTNSDWSFPIKRIKSEGDYLAVEISGLHISQEIFSLTESQAIGVIPIIVPQSEEVKVEVDSEVTQFLDGKSLKLITAHEQK